MPSTPLGVFLFSVVMALQKSDTVMVRIQEAVQLGLTSWTTADVVAWSTYRRNLRALMSSTYPGTLPTVPPYPANT